MPYPLFAGKLIRPREDLLRPPVFHSDRAEDIHQLIHQQREMCVDAIIDEVLPVPHGNRQGLTYGQLAMGLLAYILTQRDHRISTLEAWARPRLRCLSLAFGAPVGPKDFTDDRIEDLLARLGDRKARPWEQIEERLGQHLVRAYPLPMETGHLDGADAPIHSRIEAERAPIRFGRFVELLGKLDPAGIPLATAMLPSGQVDAPPYLPAWRRMVDGIGRPDFLLVADGKFSSLSNRAQVQEGGGFYLAPMPATGEVPDLLRRWVLDPPCSIQSLRPSEESADTGERWHGLELCRPMRWQGLHAGKGVEWTERWLLIHDQASADRELAGFRDRLNRAEEALEKLAQRPGTDPDLLAWKAQAVLYHFGMVPFLSINLEEQVERAQRYLGRGRPGPNRPTRWVEERVLRLGFSRKSAALEEFGRLAGWGIYVTNAPAERLSLSEVLRYWAHWQPERGFYRLKGRPLSAAPLYLRDPGHIRGLMVLLEIALRVLPLVELEHRRPRQAVPKYNSPEFSAQEGEIASLRSQ
ncbi:MAG: hypothetical protein HYS70_00900 [Nitrospinae bacterium]|nr:hypothetical protein [Nitrospinota bacterium]